MMGRFAVDSPWLLALGLLALLPWLGRSVAPGSYSWLAMVPADRWSTVTAASLRVAGSLVILALVLGIAGLHRTEETLRRLGRGAHIVLVLDRSTSMDNTFAGSAPSGDEESKARAARRLLTEFIRNRADDFIGVVAFSTQPMYVLPLTDHREITEAAVAAMDTPGLAYTNVAKGLLLGLAQFDERRLTGSRVVLLVSDGAAMIDRRSEQAIRKEFRLRHASLYWLFLHTRGDRGPLDAPVDEREDRPQVMPERYLHKFFETLSVPYTVYDAEASEALQRAIHDIDRLENRPLIYEERLPRYDLRTFCYGSALAGLIVLMGAKLAEVRAWT